MNTTTDNSTKKEIVFIELLVNLCINGFVGTVSFYLIIILTFHLIKSNIKNNLYNSTWEKLHITKSITLCVFVAVLAFVRSLTTFDFLGLNYYSSIHGNFSENQRTNADTICSALIPVSDMALTIGTCLVYVCLWLRQRIFYILPHLKALSNKCVKIFSTTILVVWFLYFAIVITCYFVFVRYKFSFYHRCEPVDKDANDAFLYIMLSWVIMTVLMEISLLGLFIYPLLNRERWRKKNIKKSNSTSILLMRVKKATALTLITALSDIVAFVLSFVVEDGITSAVFNLNMLVNLLAAIGCFDHWRSLVCPCKAAQSKSNSITDGSGIKSPITGTVFVSAVQNKTAEI